MSIEPSELLDSLNKMREISMGNTPKEPPQDRILLSFNYKYDRVNNAYTISSPGSNICLASIHIHENFLIFNDTTSDSMSMPMKFELKGKVTPCAVSYIELLMSKFHTRLGNRKTDEQTLLNRTEDITRRREEVIQELQYHIAELNNKPKLKLTVEFISGTSKEDIMNALISGDDTVISDVVIESDLGKEFPMAAKNMFRTGTSELLVRTMKSFEVIKADPRIERYSTTLNVWLYFRITESLVELDGSVKQLLDELNVNFKTEFNTAEEVPWSRPEYLTFLDNYFNYHYGHWDNLVKEYTNSMRVTSHDKRIGYLVAEELRTSGKSEESLLIKIDKGNKVKYNHVTHVPWTSSEGYIDLLAEFFAVERSVWVQNFKHTK